MDYIENITQKKQLEYLLDTFEKGENCEYHNAEAIKLILVMLKDAKAYRYEIK